MSTVSRLILPAVRILLGLMFLVFGLNGFLGFMPNPPVSPAGGAFLGALAQTGYMFPVIKALEVVAALLLLANRFVPLALALLAPIVFNIVAFHVLLTPPNVLTFIVLLGNSYLLWHFRDAYKGLFVARSEATRVAALQRDAGTDAGTGNLSKLQES